MASPLIIHILEGDIYLHLEVTEEMYNLLLQAFMNAETSPPIGASITVSFVPLIYLLWAGVLTMCIGISTNAIGESRQGENFEDEIF